MSRVIGIHLSIAFGAKAGSRALRWAWCSGGSEVIGGDTKLPSSSTGTSVTSTERDEKWSVSCAMKEMSS